MTAVLLPNGKQQYLTTAGLLAIGYKIATFDAGTSNPRTTWQDAGKIAANTNPIILDARGEASIFWDGAYKVQLQDSTGAVIWTQDGLQSSQNSFSASLVPAVTNTIDIGSVALSWRNLYLGANNAPVLDTVSGNIGYYARTAAEIAVAVTPTNFSYPPGNVLRYGADLTGVADSAAAFLQARQVATQGNIELQIPGGTYKSTATLVWGFANLRVRAYGKVTLNFPSLTGQCVTIDGGASVTNINDVSVTGEIRVVGNALTTDAWFVRACHRSQLELIAADCGCGVRINWSVATTFRIICSINENGGSFPNQTPQAGIILDQRGVGETVAGCTFLTPIIEGITAGNGIGIDLEHTLQNTFIGGTSEANRVGLRQLTQTPQDNFGNTVYGMDFEVNTQNDIVVSGGGSLTLVGINANSVSVNPNADIFGDNTTFIGGFIRQVQVEAASTGTSLIGCQLSNTGGLGITGTGPYKAIGCQLVSGARVPTAQVVDQIGTNKTSTPTIQGATTPGAQTYSIQQCQYVQVGTAGNGFVDFAMNLVLTANAGGTGSAVIAFPVAPRNVANLSQTIIIGDYTGITLGAAGRTLGIRLNPGNVLGLLLESDTGSVDNLLAIGAVGATATLVICGRYLI